MNTARIVDLPRGPTIEGTRITVYSLMEHLDGQATLDELAEVYPNLSHEQIRVACDYIRAHEKELRPEYDEIMARIRRGNPPELQARLQESHERFKRWVKEKFGRDLPESNGEVAEHD